MSKKNLTRKVLVYEIVGFVTVIIVLWADELLDLPHLLFAGPLTPVNWIESAIESIGVLILGAFVIFFSLRALKQIKYMEGFLPVCSFCKRVRIGDKWVPIEQYITNSSDLLFSHSLCPTCCRENYKEFMPPLTENCANE